MEDHGIVSDLGRMIGPMEDLGIDLGLERMSQGVGDRETVLVIPI